MADSIPHTSLPCHTLGCTNPCEQLSSQLFPSLFTSHSCNSSARSFLTALNPPQILLFCLALALQEESQKTGLCLMLLVRWGTSITPVRLSPLNPLLNLPWSHSSNLCAKDHHNTLRTLRSPHKK